MKKQTVAELTEQYIEQLEELGNQIKKTNRKLVPAYIQFAETLDLIENRPFYLFDLKENQYLFISKKYLQMLGYPDSTVLNDDFFLNSLHPDDFKENINAPKKYLDFIDSTPPQNKKRYKLISDFRLKMPDGIYVRVNEQMIVLELSGDNFPWLFFTICDIAPLQDLSAGPGAIILDTITKEVINSFGNYNKLLPESVLTKREFEILTLISKGFLSKQIAAALNISINTVNNHRRNILLKTGCSNTFEAIKFVSNFG